jgi:Resolvase, N terminal domain
MTNGNLIAYYRVSTRKQEKSGLGLEAQQAAVAEFSLRQGANLLTTYTEVETGKRADRPELAKAMAQARRARATLVVAKLDRLARNVAFTSALMESGVDFVACDKQPPQPKKGHPLGWPFVGSVSSPLTPPASAVASRRWHPRHPAATRWRG